MLLLIIFFPLIGALLAGFMGWYIGQYGAMIITTGLMILGLLVSFYAFIEIGLNGQTFYYTLGTWIKSGALNVSWGFMFDPITAIMLVVVMSISTLVHVYSCSYMGHDPHVARFMAYLSLFTFFMLILVTADNFVQIFLGWEGVGLCSYLLIGFWFTRPQASKAALKALLMNRIGDCGLLFAVAIIFYTFQAVDFNTVFACVPYMAHTKITLLGYTYDVITVICLFLFLGAVGKSAQLGLHTWLPDAMEGPTPVSALIHAATMVTAGVFLIIRCSPIFEFSPTALLVVTCIGALTALFAATIGIFQNDLKKIIAYSTCSQLGYMVFVCGLSGYAYGLFHLTTHAFFKALLFLSAGAVIHGLSNEQDIRRMGGLCKLFPVTYSMFLIGTLALIGFPFLAGFYSKDAILEFTYANYSISGLFAYWLGTTAALCTAYYSFRLIYYVFYSTTNSYKSHIQQAHEAPALLATPLFILSVGSIFSGYLLKDLLIGPGTSFFQDSIYLTITNNVSFEAEFLPTYVKLLPTVCTFVGGIGAVYVNHLSKSSLLATKLAYPGVYRFFNRKWYIDFIYNNIFAYPALRLAYQSIYKTTDKGLIELAGPTGLSAVVYRLASLHRNLQTGLLYQYMSVMFLALLALITITNLF